MTVALSPPPPASTASSTPAPQQIRLPGGATMAPTCQGTGWVALRLDGELDTHDKYAIIDAITPFVFAGCQRIHIDAGGTTFIDTAALRSFDRVRRFLERDGGTLTIDRLPRVADYVWSRLAHVRRVQHPPAHR